MTPTRGRVVCVTFALTTLLTGCATVPLDAGRDQTDALLRSRASPALAATAARASRNADRVAVDRDIAAWLSAPLSVDTAVQVALLRNPALQAQFAALGLSAADVFEAGRLRNPRLDVAVLLPQGNAVGTKWSGGLTLGFTELLLRRASSRIAAVAFAGTQAEIAHSVLALVTDTQRAWVDAVAASQRVAVRQAIDEVAAVGAELAQRYHAAGNISLLDLKVQQAAASEAGLSLQRARAELADARATLQKLLGLPAAEHWSLPQALPLPEAQPPLDLAGLRDTARSERLDLLAARQQVSALEQRLRLTQGTRWLGGSELGVGVEREGDGSRRVGPQVSLELPVFQQGQGRVARDIAALAQARAAERSIELAIDAELQQQLQRVGIAHAAAEGYRSGLIPQREAIVAQMQQRTNQMLVDTFALLLARQQEQAAYDGYVDAVQDYWRSRVALLQAVGTQLVAALPPKMEDQP